MRTYFLVSLFFLYGLAGLTRHEMWRDEMQAWMIARDSPSLPQLFDNLRYEGHPPLWHLLLFPLTRLAKDPVSMQLLHLAVATLCVWVFARFSPFPPWLKALCVFGSLFSYEYLIKSRNYSLGILFLFAACAVFTAVRDRGRRDLLVFAALFLAAQANFVSACLAVVYGAFLFAQSRAPGRAAFACTVGLLAVQTRLPPDIYYPHNLGGLFTHFDPLIIMQTCARLTPVYFGIPQKVPGVNAGLIYNLLIAAGLFLFFALVLARKPRVLLLYCAGTLGILAFSYVKVGGIYDRHTGFLLIHLLICLWLASSLPESRIKPAWLSRLSSSAGKWSAVVLLAMFSMQLYYGIRLNSDDWKKTYSEAKETAEFLKGPQFKDTILMGNQDFYVSPISGFLGRPIYYFQRHEFGTFIRWDKKRVERVILPREIIGEAEKIRSQTGKQVLVILNYLLPPGTYEDKLEIVRIFGKAMDDSEKYCVMRLK